MLPLSALRWRQQGRSKLVDAACLRRILDYDPKTGRFVWLVGKGRRVRPGMVAGTVDDGYLRVRIDGTAYRAHRLAWLFMTGSWPPSIVDHKNRDGTDNRWKNLRLASHSLNQANSERRPGVSGFRGVFPHESGGWGARIVVQGTRRRIGRFQTTGEARAAYQAAARDAFGDFARV